MNQPVTPANPSATPGFKRRIGLFTATMLVAGNMIGSGIFIVSADMARDVGGAGWLLMLWLLAVLSLLSYLRKKRLGKRN